MSTKDSVKSSGRRYAQMVSAGGIFRGGCGRNVAGQRATPLPHIDPPVVAACRKRSPNFEKAAGRNYSRADTKPLGPKKPLSRRLFSSTTLADAPQPSRSRAMRRQGLPCGARWRSWSWRQRSHRISPVGGGAYKVSKFERLLVRDSTELPECRCGSEMKIIKSDSIGSDAQVRTYQCPLCEHELRLTMWGTS